MVILGWYLYMSKQPTHCHTTAFKETCVIKREFRKRRSRLHFGVRCLVPKNIKREKSLWMKWWLRRHNQHGLYILQFCCKSVAWAWFAQWSIAVPFTLKDFNQLWYWWFQSGNTLIQLVTLTLLTELFRLGTPNVLYWGLCDSSIWMLTSLGIKRFGLIILFVHLS